jgi:hypothetical protein
VKYWEIIADNLSKAGWSWGCVATVDFNGRTIFVATHITTTESVSLCTRMKADRVRGTRISDSCWRVFVLTSWRNFSRLGTVKRI